MSSAYTRKHRTHAKSADPARLLTQPTGELHSHLPGETSGQTEADRQVLASFAQLCERVPDAARRAKMLGVSVETEAAWSRGVAVPVLRAHRRVVERALRDAGRRSGSRSEQG